MPEYLVPGVFVEELSLLPPSVAEVDTALPAFIGYTARATQVQTDDLHNVPRRIRSLAEFESCYGTRSISASCSRRPSPSAPACRIALPFSIWTRTIAMLPACVETSATPT